MKALRYIVCAVTIAVLCLPALAKDGYATINVLVVKDENGKPVRNAAVILHPVRKSGKQKNEGLETKTDKDGKCSIDSIPYGKLRIQVISPGRQTYGEDFDINQPQQDITIKLKPPQDQYTIYGDNKKDDKK